MQLFVKIIVKIQILLKELAIEYEFGRDPKDPLPYDGVRRTQTPLGINLCINFAHKLFNFP